MIDISNPVYKHDFLDIIIMLYDNFYTLLCYMTNSRHSTFIIFILYDKF